MKKKVLMIRSNPYDFNPNSYNVQEVGIGKAFCHQGYDYDYVTFKKKEQNEWVFYEENGCKARWIEKPRLRVLRMGINKDVWNKDFLNKYDIVICREYYQYVTYKVCINHSNSLIYTGPYWNMFMLKPISYLYDLLFTKKINESVKKIFTKSDLATNFMKKKGYTKLQTLGVALDVSRFNNVEIAPDTMKLIDYMTENDCILYVGEVNDNKNFPFMLKIYEKLNMIFPELKFVVIGKSKQNSLKKLIGKKDEDYEFECYKKIPLEVVKGVHRVARVDNPQLKYIYPLAKAFLLPSKKEIFGMVMLEAMYLGAPVITSINGGSTTLIKSGVNGFMMKNFEVDSWVETIKKLIIDNEYRQRIISEAHDTVEKDYNWDRLVKIMIEGTH